MSMSATRLLVLGVVQRHGQAHGYLVGVELHSWHAHEWANVKWGSIYHALRKMTAEGLLTAVERPDEGGRTDYTLTDRGRDEYARMLKDALRQPAHRLDLLSAGLALLPSLRRDEAVALFKERLRLLEAERARMDELAASWTEPAHIRELYLRWARSAASGADWTRGLIERLESGALTMAGERRDGTGGTGAG
ncbi:PadR family transcriptional regulator [Allonocardiopsis opalescens]|uniref:DNA-binding PadR family transcriptional regulator n=1 Tax=Allonocardiopsis opalescens TaxID=1144618 RepID=A0A2T0Q5B8_9ACTN|nr:PadR family transcriptional regulator [Allonocardiopsis opalescens]PRX99017.1 DNA-binding PadR family transcriptional regulator [Allonocardiopsis opalescens]